MDNLINNSLQHERSSSQNNHKAIIISYNYDLRTNQTPLPQTRRRDGYSAPPRGLRAVQPCIFWWRRPGSWNCRIWIPPVHADREGKLCSIFRRNSQFNHSLFDPLCDGSRHCRPISTGTASRAVICISPQRAVKGDCDHRNTHTLKWPT